MEITFKAGKKNRSIPFLQKFRDKINRVDRVSGLLGALGLNYRSVNVTKMKKRCPTEGNQIKVRSDPRHKRNNSQLFEKKSNFDPVLIDDFKTIGQEEVSNKQNESLNELSRLTNVKIPGRRMQESSIVEDKREITALMLPKILNRGFQINSQQNSRIKDRLLERNRKKLAFNIKQRSQTRGLLLR